MSWNALITARTLKDVGLPAVELLRNAGCQVQFAPKFGPLSAEEILPLLEGVDAVLASSDQYNAAVLAAPEAKTLKIISRWGVGYDSIDLGAATRLGIIVAYTPGLLDETVADLTFALLLAIARRVHESHFLMRKGEWSLLWGHDIHGKTLGIIGCGRIGQAVARRARGFNMRVLAYDVRARPEVKAQGIQQVELDELLAESDFVSLHAALTPQSRGMIAEKQLQRMKKTAYLINAARGALVEERALLQALQQGWIAGAALDTFANEPLPVDHPLRQAPNVLLTPHQASFGRETGERVSLAAAQAIVDLMNQKQPRWIVDPNVFESPALRARMRNKSG